MADNATQQLADILTRHDIDLLRVDAALRKKIVSMMNGLREDVIKKIAKVNPGKAATLSRKNATLRQLIQSTDPSVTKAYKAIASTVDGELKDLTKLEQQVMAKSINRVANVELLSPRVNKNVMEALVGKTLVEGKIVSKWWQAETAAFKDVFARQMREGVLNGETVDDLVRRVRGTRAGRFKDGIMALSTNRAKTLVRSSVLAVANQARMTTFQQNSDVIKGVQWLSTLDARTSNVCKALDGQSWTLGGERMKGTSIQWRGPPPAHFNCRSTLVPITRSWAELNRNPRIQKKLDGIPPRSRKDTRAAMDGRPAKATEDYEAWLRKQDVEMQKDVLGPARHKLWKDGKISFTDLIDQQHRPRTVAELTALAKGKKPPTPKPTPKPKPKTGKPALAKPPKSAVPPDVAILGRPQATTAYHQEWASKSITKGSLVDKMQKLFDQPGEILNETGSGEYHYFGLIWMGSHRFKKGSLNSQAVYRHEYGHHLDERMFHWAIYRGHLKQAPGVSRGFASATMEGSIAMNADDKFLKSMQNALIGKYVPDVPAKLSAARFDVAWDTARGAAFRSARNELLEEATAKGARVPKTHVTRLAIKHLEEAAEDGNTLARMWLQLMDETVAPGRRATLEKYSVRAYAAVLENNPAMLANTLQAIDHPTMYLNLDLVGSITKNRVGRGHSNSYYNERRGYGQNTEAFANVNHAIDNPDSVDYKFAELFAPKFTKFVKDLMELAVKESGI